MDASCLAHVLTEDERQRFERDGFLVVDDVLPPAMLEQLLSAADRVDAETRARDGLGPSDRVNLLDFIGRDDTFLELLDWPLTFPKVWGILGWHIQLYHSHLVVSPPRAGGGPRNQARFGWHQDSGRLNIDIESDPRPRISLKVGYFLTDTTVLGRANFYVVPGSHLSNNLELPSNGEEAPETALAIRVPAGSAVFFDRRLWHSATPNYSNVPRKVLFYGYSYRWLRPRDNMTVSHYMDRSDPIRRQLLGAGVSGGLGYTSPSDEDVPLKTWLLEHLGEEAVVA